ncbi:hypothetical protein STAIW_v1c04370 [Spiroplasma taiwanense CT-1]|uniref:Uncharacterized protein n=1 Tax=Spiroplasma taiwanense CT-1 TaxID=1276220 RepID=S5MBD7_9MOLU|nr:hypothetical protein STAIW_v1c04370 [Spiroplasma taiwanense CT-1]
MKYDLKDKAIISDENEIKNLNSEFEKLNEKFREKNMLH